MMEEYFNTLLQETERRMAAAAAGMEGKETVATCREMVSYLKAKNRELKAYALARPFSGDEEEIRYSVAQVKEACKKLPVGYRVILSLYLFEGYDMEEIASILKIRPSSVRSQYLRAKRKLLDIIAANKENG